MLTSFPFLFDSIYSVIFMADSPKNYLITRGGGVKKCRKFQKYEEKIQHLLKSSEEKIQKLRTIYTPEIMDRKCNPSRVSDLKSQYLH